MGKLSSLRARTAQVAVAVLLLGFQMMSAAQTTQPAGARNQILIIGCIKRATGSASPSASNNLTITDYRGGPAGAFQLDPQDRNVSVHVDHMVELIGTIAGGPSGATRALPRLDVHVVHYLSRTCWPRQGSAAGSQPAR